MTDLWYGTRGSPNAPIVIVGESWGAEEKKYKQPFVGSSGHILNSMLQECGISQSDVLFTNIVAEQPDGNETFRFFLPKDAHPNAKRVGGLIPSGLVDAEMRRLYLQLAHRPRTLVISAGNWSLWGLSYCTGAEVLRESNGRRIPTDQQTFAPNGIMNWRGSMWHIEPHEEYLEGDRDLATALLNTKLLPIIHPAAIMRSWDLRQPTIHDLTKRVRQARLNDWRRNPTPDYHFRPTYNDITTFLKDRLEHMDRGNELYLANDIETIQRRFISCIGFSDNLDYALTIPLIREKKRDGELVSYWSPSEETEIIRLGRRVLTHRNARIIGQNYIYDTQYIQHWWGCIPRLFHDTMLAQNVVFPGTPKDLGYLSSLYCDYHWYWKDDAKDWNQVDDNLLRYNCEDTCRTYEVGINQMKYIKSVGQEDQMRFKMRTNALCLRMMNRGILMDNARSGSMRFELEAAQTAFYKELLDIIPQEWVKPIRTKADKYWYRSAKQTQEVFYNLLGFSVVNHKKTGNPTVGKEALAVLERKYPEFTGLFRRLDYAGSVTNTLSVIKTPVEADGRMRCSYNPGGTETHRLSSSENVFGRGTNLQNLTKGEEDD